MPVEVVNESSTEFDAQVLQRQGEWLLTALRLHPDTELSVALVDDDRMEALHIEWMDEPGPTDVLSFPMDDLRIPTEDELPVPGVLGDVILCPQVAARQAMEANHTLGDELTLLLTHGVLHLLGHDHAEPAEHAEMFALQESLVTLWKEQR